MIRIAIACVAGLQSAIESWGLETDWASVAVSNRPAGDGGIEVTVGAQEPER